MHKHWVERSMAYDGSQLRSLFAYENFALQGDSVISWIGPCHVSNEHMVDMEDLKSGDGIAGNEMLHFLIEVFQQDLVTTTTLQRLVMAGLVEILGVSKVRRDGDDLYVGTGKLSISIATVSPVSGLIHLAINLTNEGTPVETSCLEDLSISMTAKELAGQLMAKTASDWEQIHQASCKVKWVK